VAAATALTRSRFPWAAALLVCAFAGVCLPFFVIGMPRGHSVESNLAWHLGFCEELEAGTLYPRWLSSGFLGFGSPSFYFYGPLPFYVSAAFQTVLPPDMAWHAVGASFGLGIALSGLFAFLWLRRHVDPGIAAVCALVYVVLPYHYEFDALRRAAIGEVWAYVWMPIVLLGVDRLAAGRRGGFVVAVVGYLGLFLSHPPATVVFSWLPLGYAVFASDRRWRCLLATSLAFVCSLALAAPYLATAVLTQKHAVFAFMWEDWYSFTNHFLLEDSRTEYRSRLNVVLLSMAAASAACVAFLYVHRATMQVRRPLVWFWALACAAVGLLMVRVSEPLWWASRVLPKLQFPSRFLLVLDVAFAWLLAAFLATRRGAGGWAGRSIVAGLIVGGVVMAGIGAYRTRWHFIGESAQNERIQRYAEKGFDWWRPVWAGSEIAASWDDEGGLTPEAAREVRGAEGRILAYSQKGSTISVTVESAAAADLVVGQFYYPAWVATDVGAGRELETAPSTPEGLLTVRVPEGKTDLVIRRGFLPEERWGYAIAGAALLFLVAGHLYRRRSGQAPAAPGERA
jgi:hypothetical protein